MTPLQPFKPSDFAKLFSPKLPPVVPPSGNVNPVQPEGNDNTLLYWGMSFVFIVYVLSTGYSIYQNVQILKGLESMNESTQRIIPAIASYSQSIKVNNNENGEQQSKPDLKIPGKT